MPKVRSFIKRTRKPYKEKAFTASEVKAIREAFRAFEKRHGNYAGNQLR